MLDLVDQAVDRDLFVSFDANLRESFVEDTELTWSQVRSLGAQCTLVKLSDEDAGLLAPGTDPDDVARTLLAGERTELVLLTRGADGATAFTPAGTVSVTAATGRGRRHGRGRRRLHGRDAGSARRRLTPSAAGLDTDARRPRAAGHRRRRGGRDHLRTTRSEPTSTSGAACRLARLTCCPRNAASTWSITTGSTAIPQ